MPCFYSSVHLFSYLSINSSIIVPEKRLHFCILWGDVLYFLILLSYETCFTQEILLKCLEMTQIKRSVFTQKVIGDHWGLGGREKLKKVWKWAGFIHQIASPLKLLLLVQIIWSQSPPSDIHNKKFIIFLKTQYFTHFLASISCPNKLCTRHAFSKTTISCF